MQFANDTIWLILLVPLMAGLIILRERKRTQRLAAFADVALLPQIYPRSQQSARRLFWQICATTLVTLLVVLALLQPQYGFTWKESKGRGVDLVVAIDVSDSMLAEDVKPNRLERARREVLDLLDNLQGDRVALVAFAGTAFIELPLTLDYPTFRLYLNSLDTDMIPVKGTDLELALTKSIDALNFRKPTADETAEVPENSRAVVLITDGEDLQGGFERVKELAEEKKVTIYIVGVGTPEGAPIPTANGYKKDKQGQIVITKLNESELAELALKTGGIFVKSISSALDTQTIYQAGIKNTLEARETAGGRTKRWNEYFQLPLLLALLILLIEPLAWLSRQLRGSAVLFLFAFMSSVLPAHAQTAERLGAQGKREFQDGEFDKSFSTFEEASRKSAEDYRMDLGKGAAAYRLGKTQEAAASFLSAAGKAKEPADKAVALFNGGNALVQAGNLNEALKSYEESLKLAPDDADTKANLAYVKRLLEEQKKQQQEKKNQDKQNQQQNKDKQQEEQQKQDSKSEENDEQDKKPKDQNEEQEQGTNQSQEENQGEKTEEEQPQDKQQEQQDSEQEQSKEGGSESEDKSEQQQGNKSKEDKQQETDGAEDKEQQESDGKGEKNEQDKQAGSKPGEQSQEKGPETDDQLEALLGNVEEGKQSLQQYRMRKALGELQSRGQRKPEKDW